MTERRRGLGRGLGALIPAAPEGAVGTAVVGAAGGLGGSGRPSAVSKVAGGRRVPAPTADRDGEVVQEAAAAADVGGELAVVAGARFAEIPVDAISPNERQPRDYFDDEALHELVQSIREVGLLQPVVVRPRQAGDGFELVMGERRWRACQEAGLSSIPAIIRQTDDEKMLLDALLENLHRAQLNPLEEAAAYDQLLHDFACTHEQLADRIGRSRAQVSNTLRLLKLSPAVQPRVAAGVLSAGHARALLAVADPDGQDRLAHRIVAEGLSVRAVEEIVAMMGMDDAGAGRVRRPRAGRRVSPALTDLASRLSDRFETRVKVDLGQKKGKIVVEFASIDDLERILGSLAPGEGKILGAAADGEGVPAADDGETSGGSATS